MRTKLHLKGFQQFQQEYKSNAQIARVVTEAWLSAEMYCPCCLNGHIEQFPRNQKVSDFYCEKCRNNFQLKGSSKQFVGKVVDGEYHTMLRFVSAGNAPNFFFLHYSRE